MTTFNYDPDLLQKVIIGDESWVMTLNQSPIIPIEASRRAKTEKSPLSSVKCQM